MSSHNKTTESANTQDDIVKMIVALQEKSTVSRNTITINPMTAFISAGLIILVLIQFVIGFGMWSIQDRLKRYDAYGTRIESLEKSLVRFESIPVVIESLVSEIRLLSKSIDEDTDSVVERVQKLETELEIMRRSLK